MSGDTIRVLDNSEDAASRVQSVPTDLAHINMGLFSDVRVALEARLGEAPMTVETIMGLKTGSIVALETSLADHVDLFLNNVLVARGEIVAVGGKYGVRIVEIAEQP